MPGEGWIAKLLRGVDQENFHTLICSFIHLFISLPRQVSKMGILPVSLAVSCLVRFHQESISFLVFRLMQDTVYALVLGQ